MSIQGVDMLIDADEITIGAVEYGSSGEKNDGYNCGWEMMWLLEAIHAKLRDEEGA